MKINLVDFSVLVLVVSASGLMLMRVVIIAVGMLKEPVLTAMARYESIDAFYLLPLFLLMITIFIGSISGLVGMFQPTARFGLVLAIPLAIFSYMAFAAHPLASRYPHIMCPLPRWYADLRAETTREERRRIAYMWLRLPLRNRLRYNISNTHFRLWCDLVILGTVTQTMNDTAVKAEGQVVVHDLERRLYS